MDTADERDGSSEPSQTFSRSTSNSDRRVETAEWIPSYDKDYGQEGQGLGRSLTLDNCIDCVRAEIQQ